MKTPDLTKVEAAVAAIELARAARKPAFRELPPRPVTAQDAAIRKPLRSHGNPCRSGFSHPNFLNRD